MNNITAMFSDPIFRLIVAAIVIAILLASIPSIIRRNRIKRLRRYWDVRTGMSEDEMLSIMGPGYDRSILKNNRVKYEWRVTAVSHGSSSHGFSSRVYSGVKKVAIYTTNGIVEEIKPYNVE